MVLYVLQSAVIKKKSLFFFILEIFSFITSQNVPIIQSSWIWYYINTLTLLLRYYVPVQLFACIIA